MKSERWIQLDPCTKRLLMEVEKSNTGNHIAPERSFVPFLFFVGFIAVVVLIIFLGYRSIF